MNYWELNFKVDPKTPWSEILIAELGEIGFESFMETETGFLAYIAEVDFNEVDPKEIYLITQKEAALHISYTKNFIPEQNWNETWESSFEPVSINKELLIMAPFHQVENEYRHAIIIEPKMSFGTGHHQTTRLMSRALLDEPCLPKIILDMGCGTGVLAILAEKLGADNILAIDTEAWAYANAVENAERNNCKHIRVLHGDAKLLTGLKFDLILANINKNVLLQDMPIYSNCLNDNGLLFISGFFKSDEEILVNSAKNCNLALVKSISEDNWSCLQLVKRG
jgi:ribosomal protein L11 methyltransferase